MSRTALALQSGHDSKNEPGKTGHCHAWSDLEASTCFTGRTQQTGQHQCSRRSGGAAERCRVQGRVVDGGAIAAAAAKQKGLEITTTIRRSERSGATVAGAYFGVAGRYTGECRE